MENTEKMYSQKELDDILEQERKRLREEAVSYIAEKSTEIAEKKANIMALQIAERQKELSIEERLFEQDKQQIQFYIEQQALPTDMTLWKMMMNRQLWRELWLSLIQTINWVAYVRGKPTIYWETYLSLITKNWYKINVLKENEEEVEVELVWKNWSQKWKATKKEAEKAWVWKDVYLKYPVRMLRYKAIRNAQNVLCPEIMWGAYLYEEASEIQTGSVELPDDEILNEKLAWFEAQEGEQKNIS